jgi:hypothetical protein
VVDEALFVVELEGLQHPSPVVILNADGGQVPGDELALDGGSFENFVLGEVEGDVNRVAVGIVGGRGVEGVEALAQALSGQDQHGPVVDLDVHRLGGQGAEVVLDHGTNAPLVRRAGFPVDLQVRAQSPHFLPAGAVVRLQPSPSNRDGGCVADVHPLAGLQKPAVARVRD